METIRKYLETMFMSLPDTDATRRAKEEIMSMTEDKYNELIESGMSENEAVGKIITEFGTIDDLKDSLGAIEKGTVRRPDESFRPDETFSQGVHGIPNPPVEVKQVTYGRGKSQNRELRLISVDEANAFLDDCTFSRFLLGLGVACCIIAPTGPIMGSAISENFYGFFGDFFSALGVVFLFIAVALGVGLIILSSAKNKEWSFLRRGVSILDSVAEEYIRNEKADNISSKSTMLAMGIVLCVCSVIPVIFFGIFSIFPFLSEGVGPALIFVITGAGVFFIINSSRITDACDRLLGLNA